MYNIMLALKNELDKQSKKLPNKSLTNLTKKLYYNYHTESFEFMRNVIKQVVANL